MTERYHLPAASLLCGSCGKPWPCPEAGLREVPDQRVRHNHTTRDIKPLGQCPVCDIYHARGEK